MVKTSKIIIIDDFQNCTSSKKRNEIIEYIKQKVVKDLFNYFDVTLFNKWTDEIREFLVVMASFNEFSPSLAQKITGKPDFKDIIDSYYFMDSFLIFYSPETYKINIFLKKYWLYKQKGILSEERLENIYSIAGNYYETIVENKIKVLKYYLKAKEGDKVKKN